MPGFLEILELTVSADAFALLRVHPDDGSADILGGRGLKIPVERWSEKLEAPHIAKQAANFPDKPAIAAIGSFVCDPLLAEEQARSLVMSRLGIGEDYLVTLAVRREGKPFSSHEVERFAAVAGVINLVGRSCYLEQECEERLDKDGLTGLGQFPVFHDGLIKELSRARRGAGRMTVGILSLDRKDEMPPSDPEVLTVARILCDQLRNFDTLVRYSPVEFAFILPDLKVTEGVKVMERVQGGIEEALAGFPDPSWTCVGLSGYPDDAASVERLIEIAEAAANQVREGGAPGVSRWKE
ncbi:MAG: diguanylate cyclase [bacterium]|nr:diguanylate cyclase [bacterium]